MQSRHAGLTIPLAVGIVTGGALLALRRMVGEGPGERVLLIVIGAAVLQGVIARIAVWSWRRLWRDAPREGDRWNWVVYDLGVKRFGAVMALIMPPLNAVTVAWNDGTESRSVATLVVMLMLWVGFFLWLSLGLWGGYWWGRVMARAWGLRPPAE
jgi:hypothetical protein